MATMRSKPPVPVGSAQWVLDERIQGTDFVTQEVEEFHFSVRNDMEWLNEHMADIFQRNHLYGAYHGARWMQSLQDHSDVAEAFKTPGKLRGKTPRTVRRRGLETRAVGFSSTLHHRTLSNSYYSPWLMSSPPITSPIPVLLVAHHP